MHVHFAHPWKRGTCPSSPKNTYMSLISEKQVHVVHLRKQVHVAHPGKTGTCRSSRKNRYMSLIPEKQVHVAHSREIGTCRSFQTICTWQNVHVAHPRSIGTHARKKGICRIHKLLTLRLLSFKNLWYYFMCPGHEVSLNLRKILKKLQKHFERVQSMVITYAPLLLIETNKFKVICLFQYTLTVPYLKSKI